MRYRALASRNFKETFRNPLSLGLGAAMPCAFLWLFSALGKRAPLPVFQPQALTPALTVFSFSFLIMFAAVLVSKDRASGFFQRMLATPLKSADYAAAYLLPFLPVSALQIAACYGVGAALGSPAGLADMAASLLALMPALMLCIGLGLTLGSLGTENQVAGFGSAGISAIGILSGAWFDLEAAGGAFAAAARILPFSRAVNAARALYAGASPRLSDMLVIYAYALPALAAGALCMTRRARRY